MYKKITNLMNNTCFSFKYTIESEEVLYTEETVTKISDDDISHLIYLAKNTKRKRIRICAHPSKDHPVHDMLIVHFNDTYVRPHRHIKKDETFHIIRGELNVVIFNDDGSIMDIIEMGEFGKGKVFFYRMSKSLFHTVIPVSEIVVFHETTKGPFSFEDTKFPGWAPDGSSFKETKLFLKMLKEKMVF